VLALIFSALAECMVFLIVWFFSVIGYRHLSALQDYYFYFFVFIHGGLGILLEWTHILPQLYSMWIVVVVAVVQWWLIFLTAIWTFRYFRRRHEPAA
jgi:hypothetical protein